MPATVRLGEIRSIRGAKQELLAAYEWGGEEFRFHAIEMRQIVFDVTSAVSA
jgi:hypothetical protein